MRSRPACSKVHAAAAAGCHVQAPAVLFFLRQDINPAYNLLLRSELLGAANPGPISPDKAQQLEQLRSPASPGKKLLRFKAGDVHAPLGGPQCQSPFAVAPVGDDSTSTSSPFASPRRAPRKIARAPFKVGGWGRPAQGGRGSALAAACLAHVLHHATCMHGRRGGHRTLTVAALLCSLQGRRMRTSNLSRVLRVVLLAVLGLRCAGAGRPCPAGRLLPQPRGLVLAECAGSGAGIMRIPMVGTYQQGAEPSAAHAAGGGGGIAGVPASWQITPIWSRLGRESNQENG